MSDLELSRADVERLRVLTGVLIPGTASMPGVVDLPAFEGLLRAAADASAVAGSALRTAIDGLPERLDWDSVRDHAGASPEEFGHAAALVSAAYYMDPVVLTALGYSVERRHPARLDEFADEYESGVLDRMMQRPPSWRDPRQARQNP